MKTECIYDTILLVWILCINALYSFSLNCW
nr:MAG TPA: hypothetical protein [Caudoviricetes sp.]